MGPRHQLADLAGRQQIAGIVHDRGLVDEQRLAPVVAEAVELDLGPRHRRRGIHLGLTAGQREVRTQLLDRALEQRPTHRRHGVEAGAQMREVELLAPRMIEDGLVHQRQTDEHGQPIAHDRLHAGDRVEAAHQRHAAADREIAEQQHVAGTVEQRELPGDAVVARELHLDAVAHHGHDHGEVTMHRALRPRRRARRVDDHREIAVVDLDLGLDVRMPLDEVVEAGKPRGPRRPGEIDGDQLDAALFQRRPPLRLRNQIVVDEREPHLGMAEDVVHVGGPEHGVDRHPDQAGTVDAEQRFDELDRVVADRRDCLAWLQPLGEEMVREPVGIALELGERHLAAAIGDRNPIREAPRRALQEIADRNPADPARTGHAAGGLKIGH